MERLYKNKERPKVFDKIDKLNGFKFTYHDNSYNDLSVL